MPVWLILFCLPTTCIASTPPVQPSLVFDVSNQSADQDAPVTFSVTWNRYDIFALPPEQILVNVFFVPDGSHLGSFLIPKTGHVCPSADTCVYRTAIEGKDFPPGTFMLIAEDPLSGSTNRQMISIPLHSEVNSEFFKKSEHEQVFTLISVTIGLFLLFVLTVLVRR